MEKKNNNASALVVFATIIFSVSFSFFFRFIIFSFFTRRRRRRNTPSCQTNGWQVIRLPICGSTLLPTLPLPRLNAAKRPPVEYLYLRDIIPQIQFSNPVNRITDRGRRGIGETTRPPRRSDATPRGQSIRDNATARLCNEHLCRLFVFDCRRKKLSVFD